MPVLRKYEIYTVTQHLDNKYLHDIDKAVIESIIHAKLKEGVSKTKVNPINTD
jgi:hypothetical protein